MSTEYRNKYMNKVMADATRYVVVGGTQIGLQPYIKSRLRHYGMLNKYLPHDFKKDDVVKILEQQHDNNKDDQTETSGTEG